MIVWDLAVTLRDWPPRLHLIVAVCLHFSVFACQPGLVQCPLRKTKVSVTRPEVSDRLPRISVSYTYWLYVTATFAEALNFGTRKLQPNQFSTRA